MGDGCGPRPGSPLHGLPLTTGWLWLLATGLLCGLAAPPSAAEDACRPWPGEPEPLPTVASSDLALSRWSELRVAELAAVAQLAEDGDPSESHRLWRRVLCFDPANRLAWSGLDRTRPVRIYRPELRWGRGSVARPAGPWEGLAATVLVGRPALAPPRASAPAPAPQEAEALAATPGQERWLAALAEAELVVAAGERSLRAAHFEEALFRAAVARRALDGVSGAGDDAALRTRVEVLSATAQVALGDEQGARQSFSRALASDPALRLDPMLTSPKVMQALEDARGEGRP